MTADVTDIADDTPPRSQEPVDIARRLEAIHRLEPGGVRPWE